MNALEALIIAWIREDAPVSVKMSLMPEHVRKLAGRITEALPPEPDALAAQPPKADGGVVLKGAFTECDITQGMIQAGRYAANLSDGTLARIYLAMREAELAAAPPLNTGSAVSGGATIPIPETTPEQAAYLRGLGPVLRATTQYDDQTRIGPAGPAAGFDGYGSKARPLPAPAEAGEGLAGFLPLVDELSAATLALSFTAPSEAQMARLVDAVAALVLTCDAHRSGRLTPAASRPVEQSEPVAWAYEYRWTANSSVWTRALAYSNPGEDPRVRNVRPLYAHPAPAAPRPAVGREEIARKAAELRAEAKTLEKVGSYTSADQANAVAEAYEEALALIDPSDDTRAGGADAQEGGR